MPCGTSRSWHDFLQPLAVLGVGDLAGNAAAARRVGHQHRIAAGERQVGGQRGALVAAFFLDDLHQQDLPALDDFLDLVLAAHRLAADCGLLRARPPRRPIRSRARRRRVRNSSSTVAAIVFEADGASLRSTRSLGNDIGIDGCRDRVTIVTVRFVVLPASSPLPSASGRQSRLLAGGFGRFVVMGRMIVAIDPRRPKRGSRADPSGLARGSSPLRSRSCGHAGAAATAPRSWRSSPSPSSSLVFRGFGLRPSTAPDGRRPGSGSSRDEFR